MRDITLRGRARQREASSLYQQLSSASGAQFDQIYIQHMLSGHKLASLPAAKQFVFGTG